jgi:hypothetical protein
MTTKTKERLQLGRRRRRRVGGGGWTQARGGRDARAPHRCRCSSHPLPSPPPHHPTTTSHPIRALLRSSPIRSARSPSPLPPAMSSSSPPPRPDDDDGAQEVGASDGRSLGYGEAEYWDARYVEEGGAPYDWYQRYDALRPFVRCFAPPASRILMVGCGSARTQSAPTHFLLVTSNSTHRTISNSNSGRAEFSLLRRCFAFFQ